MKAIPYLPPSNVCILNGACMKAIFRLAILLLLPQLAGAQPAENVVRLIDGTVASQKASVSPAGAVKTDSSAVTQPVSGTFFQGTQPVSGTFWQATQPTSATQTGTWTVQPGNTPNTSPWLVTTVPATTGGLSKFHLVSAATTNQTNVKASAGQLCGWMITNTNAAIRKVAFHNTAGSPTAGTGVTDSFVIPGGGAANAFSDLCISFSTGIAISTVTGIADNDAVAVGLNDLVINLYYK